MFYLFETLKEQSIEILAVSEVRWPGHGVCYGWRSHSLRTVGSLWVALIFIERVAVALRAAGSVTDSLSKRIAR